jgi:hypothetical protein
MKTIAFQTEFRPALPVVFGAKDYREFRATLEEMDRILTVTGIEDRMITRHLKSPAEAHPEKQFRQSSYKKLRQALRYNILLALTGLSYRVLSQRVSDSALFQWFTHTSEIDGVRPASKSTIERFEKLFSGEVIAQLIHDCNTAIADPAGAQELLYAKAALEFDEIFADTTCVKNNIHYPVDWVLLRDATRTLIKSMELIRSRGLKHRMGNPKEFLRRMNNLCIEMTHVRKKKGAKKMRKNLFRRMKKLMKSVEKHARSHYDLLETRWQETDWSKAQTQVVLDRIQNILDQLPQTVYQAHERLIGERRVANKDKILSLYEPDVHVLVRGKADAEVEFGNGFYLAEQADGLIVDWKFIKEQPPGDSKLVADSLMRLTENYGKPKSYSADRGFDAEDNRTDLKKQTIFNAICPRSVPNLKERLEDDVFCRLQKRRAGTEARIGIFKNAYLGTPLRNKGFNNRNTRLEWCVLAHNLWKLARMAAQNREVALESQDAA